MDGMPLPVTGNLLPYAPCCTLLCKLHQHCADVKKRYRPVLMWLLDMLQEVCMEHNILLETSVLGTQLAFETLYNFDCC